MLIFSTSYNRIMSPDATDGLINQFETLPGISVERYLNLINFILDGKVVGYIRDGAVALALPEARVNQLVTENQASNLKTGNRVLKQWAVLTPPNTIDLADNKSLLEEAVVFASSETYSREGLKVRANKWFILVLLALAQFMVVLDVSIVNVALPSIQRSFDMSAATLQWIITAYTLMFGGFLLLGGRSADLFGRRRTFLLGVSVFTLASLGTGLSQTGGMLIAFRAIQGLAAAFMSPSALSMVLVTFHEGNTRNVALSVWGAVASAGAAVGVLVGGIFTQYLGWRWNFFINFPVGIFIIVAALRVLSRHESEAAHRNLDLPGAFLITFSLMILVYALEKAPSLGWGSTQSLLYFTISAIALVLFIVNESRASHPLVPLQIFKTPNLAAADVLMLLIAATMFSAFFFSSLYLQDILGYSPLRTGLYFLPIPIAIAIVATNIPRVIKRVGFKPILICAPLLVSAGLFWLSYIQVNDTYLHHVLPSFILLGIGMGATIVSVTIAATSGATRQESGLASGLLTTSQQIGGSLGLAILASIAASATTHYIHTAQHLVPANELAAEAAVYGFHRAFLVAGCFGIIASLIAILAIRRKTATANNTAPEQAARMAA